MVGDRLGQGAKPRLALAQLLLGAALLGDVLHDADETYQISLLVPFEFALTGDDALLAVIGAADAVFDVEWRVAVASAVAVGGDVAVTGKNQFLDDRNRQGFGIGHTVDLAEFRRGNEDAGFEV